MGSEGVEAEGESRVGRAPVVVVVVAEEDETEWEEGMEGQEVVSLESWVGGHQGPVAVAARRVHRALNVKLVEERYKGRRQSLHGLLQVTWSRWRNLPT